jgi:hypothetical protein
MVQKNMNFRDITLIIFFAIGWITEPMWRIFCPPTLLHYTRKEERLINRLALIGAILLVWAFVK